MMAPRYRDITTSDIPVVRMENGVEIRVVCGQVGEVEGPVSDIVIEPQYLDISLTAQTKYEHPTCLGHTVFAYVIEGEGYFAEDMDTPCVNGTVILFSEGERLFVMTRDKAVRFLLISGKPLNEPVAWRGPIVMNTQEELETAFKEYRQGTFIKR
jgi:hypothetical protein